LKEGPVVTDNIENLTLKFMRRLDTRLDRLENDIGDIKLRVTATEEHLASIMMSMAGVNSRMDKIDERLAHVERRLDLTDAA
jgi:predicted  nucleic acid-binding Zn-ribbon protein